MLLARAERVCRGGLSVTIALGKAVSRNDRRNRGGASFGQDQPRRDDRSLLRPHPRPRRSRRSSSRCGRRRTRSPRPRRLPHAASAILPLYGVPVAVKDNIDVKGLPTTAACPAFAYTPARDATCVERLRRAGAIIIGKTNLDQFATGLVGVRTPYGVARNLFDPALIPGGSSSGSGIAVGAGLVPLALGTDTAGSGRVPAALEQHRRPQAEPRPRLDRGRRAGVPHARLRVGVRAHRRRRLRCARRDRRSGCRRPLFAPAPARRARRDAARRAARRAEARPARCSSATRLRPKPTRRRSPASRRSAAPSSRSTSSRSTRRRGSSTRGRGWPSATSRPVR